MEKKSIIYSVTGQLINLRRFADVLRHVGGNSAAYEDSEIMLSLLAEKR